MQACSLVLSSYTYFCMYNPSMAEFEPITRNTFIEDAMVFAQKQYSGTSLIWTTEIRTEFAC